MHRPEFMHALRSLLGDEAVLSDAPSPAHPAGQGSPQAGYLDDWRGRYRGRALAIALVRDVAQVAATVRLCAAHGVTIVPQGGNTSLVGGSVPDHSGQQLLLNLTRMNRVLAVDPANLSLTAEAGCTLAQVQEAAAQVGLLFPLSLGSQGSCTIGGNLATNAGGTQVLRYGTARDLCLGLEVVTARGDIWNGLTALRKDNSGYSLREVFIGSEGTLGVITAATLRLHPQPVGQLAALAACPTLEAAVALLQRARKDLDAGLSGFEVMQAWSLDLVAQHVPQHAAAFAPLSGRELGSKLGGEPAGAPPWTVLLEACSPHSDRHARTTLEDLLARAIQAQEVTQASVAQSHAHTRAMWALREAIPNAERAEGLMVKHDIAVPTSAVPDFVRTAQGQLHAAFPGCRIVCFGHLGDGNLHYNVQAPPGMPAAQFVARHERQVNQIVYDAALGLGGTLSAEHGIGQLKRDELGRRKSAVALHLMRAIKQALDPQGLMNPGRLLPPSAEGQP